MTANQNVTIAGVDAGARDAIDALIERFRLDAAERGGPLRRDALACVALPTCALAMAEAERYLPQLLGRVETLLEGHGLAGLPLSLRMTGCRTAARGRTSPRSASSAKHRDATTCISAATPGASG